MDERIKKCTYDDPFDEPCDRIASICGHCPHHFDPEREETAIAEDALVSQHHAHPA